MYETLENGYRIYKANECCVFRKTKETFGGLSNMSAGFPLKINGHTILTSEALYQACKFTHYPNIQEKILNERSPMTAKMVTKPYQNYVREDWENIKIKVMRWCLQMKLAQNYIKFGLLLEQTGKRDIVEESAKDSFWGTIRRNDNLCGVNALGRLLMELRENYYKTRYSYDTLIVNPLAISDFYLLGQPIFVVDMRDSFIKELKIALYNKI